MNQEKRYLLLEFFPDIPKFFLWMTPVNYLEEAVDEIPAVRAVVMVIRVLPDIKCKNRVCSPDRSLVVFIDHYIVELVAVWNVHE